MQEKSITVALVYTYWHVDELQQLNALVMTPHKLQKVSSYFWKLFFFRTKTTKPTLKKKVYVKTLVPKKPAPSAYHAHGHFSILTLNPA